MNQTKIHFDLSDIVEQLLQENRITVEDILSNEPFDAEVTYGVLPYKLQEGARDKKLIPIVISSSAAIISIGIAVSTVLSTIYSKPYLVEFHEIQELKDEEGQLVLDQDHDPIYKTIKKYELLEPRKEDIQKELEINFDKSNGVSIKIKLLEDQE